MAKKLTHEEFIEEMIIKHPNIEVLDKYVDNGTKIKVRCKVDGHEWYSTRRRLINQNKGCPECAGNIKKTNEQFMKDFHKKNPHANDIKIKSKYNGAKEKIDCECKICGHKWSTTPDTLTNKKTGCPNCYDLERGKASEYTHEQFMKKFYKKNSHANDIEILGEYQGSNIPIHCRCRIDGHEWFPKPNKLLQNRGCPECAGNIKKTNEQFLQELKEINPYVKPLEDYKDALTQIKCECLIDGEIWYPTPSDLINNLQGCPKCAIRNISGENHYRWNSNLTDEERENRRKTKEYIQFTKKALKYFNYTCQLSGQYGGELEVHHLNGYNWCIEGRMDINNVIVITKEIHKEFHDIYGRGNNTKEQFEEFIQNYYNKDLEDRDIV